MAVTSTSINEGLKVYYRGQRLEEVLYGAADRVALNTIRKVQVQGRSMPVPVYYARSVDRSATYSDMLNSATSPTVAEFDPGANLANNYQKVDIQSEALARAKSGDGAFLTAQIMRTNEAIQQMATDTEFALFGDGTGQIGVVNNTGFATAVMDLVTDSDARKFEPGMRCVFAATATGALRDSGDSLTVQDVDAVAGNITFTTNLSNITGIAQNDIVFPIGDAANGGAIKKIRGFAAWAGSTASAAEDFMGVDRTDHLSRLAMLDYTGSQADIRKSIVDAAAYAHSLNGGRARVNRCFLNYNDWARLSDQVEGQIDYRQGQGAVVGFQFISVNGPSGPIEVVSTAMLDEGKAAVLAWDTWALYHLNNTPIRINNDDGDMARLVAAGVSSQPGIRIESDSYAQLCSSNPGHNVWLDISS